MRPAARVALLCSGLMMLTGLLAPRSAAADDRDVALQAFQRRHGQEWSLQLDARTRSPRRLAGGAIPLASHTLADDVADLELLTRALAFMRDNAELLDVDADRLRLTRDGIVRAAGGHLRYLGFEVTSADVPVIGARVTLAVSRGNLIYVHLTGTDPVTADWVPSVSERQAISAALGATSLKQSQLRAQPGVRLAFLPVEGGHTLVWELVLTRNDWPQRWRVRVDARTGGVVSTTDETVEACAVPTGGDRRVLGGVRPESAADAERVELLSFATIGGAAGGEDGFFTAPAPPYSGRLTGSRVHIECAGCSSPVMPLAPADPSGDIDFSSGGTDQTGNGAATPSDRACYFHAENALRFTERWLSLPFLSQQLVIHTNLPSACNAYWDGSSLNFFRSSSRCANTGEIRDVIAHELGHGLDDNDGLPTPGLSVDAATGEAAADILAILRSRDACMGETFFNNPSDFPSTNCSGVRDLDELAVGHEHGSPATMTLSNVVNLCAPSGFYRGPRGREGHCEGEIFAQAVWHLIQNLRTGVSYGDGSPIPGGALAEEEAWQVVEGLYFNSRPILASYAPMMWQSIGVSAYDAFLIVDDTGDGLANGTPHAAWINEAFLHHEMTEPTLVIAGPPCAGPADPIVTTTTTSDPITGLPAIQVQWASVPSAASYRVLRADDPTDSYLTLGPTFGPGAGMHLDRGLVPGRSYAYRVVAEDANGCLSPGAVPVAATSGPLLRVASIVVDDSLAANPNGLLEAGETADLYVEIANDGTAPATGLQVTLASTDPALVVLAPGPIAYGTIAAGASVTAPTPFSVQANAGVARYVTLVVSGETPTDCPGTTTVFEVASPSVSPAGQSIDDTAFGDGDGTWEPGERILFRVDLANDGLLDADPVAGLLRFRGPPVAGITIVQGGATYGLVAAGAAPVASAMPYILDANIGLGPRTVVPLTLDVSISGQPHNSFDIDLTVGSFPPGMLEWSYTGSTPLGLDLITPLVLQMTDDDGDNMITECDTPDIVAIQMATGLTRGLIVLSGDGSGVHWELDDATTNTYPFGAIAGGDIDGDGWNEIVLIDRDGYVAAFTSFGTMLWRSANPAQADQIELPSRLIRAAPQIWDLDGDGTVEIVAGLTILDGATGAVQWEHTDANRGRVLVGDFDLDGMMDILSSYVAYRGDGSPYPPAFFPAYVGLYAGVIANMDADPFPELVVPGFKTWNHDGSLLHNVDAAAPQVVGPGAAADFDGDGFAEVAYPSRTSVTVTDDDGSIMWSTPTNDPSGGSGLSLFDFDGDGTPEIVYRDELELMVLDGKSGLILWRTPVGSGTAFEYPLIADVDNDGSAEIIVLQTRIGVEDLMVFGNPLWASARPVWNQEDYTGSQIDDFGGIISSPIPSFAGNNDFHDQGNGQYVVACICTPPTIEVVPATTCGTSNVCFSANLTGNGAPYTMTWDFGDGSLPVNATSPCHMYPGPGSYVVVVRLTDGAGCVATGGVLVQVRDEPTVDFVPASGCAGETICLNAVAGGGLAPYAITWDYDDGSALESGAAVCHVFPAGTFDVTVFVQDANGCLTEQTHTMTFATSGVPADVGNTLLGVRQVPLAVFQWTASANAVSHVFRRDDVKPFTTSVILASPPGVTASDAIVPADTIHFYRVMGVNCLGLEGP